MIEWVVFALLAVFIVCGAAGLVDLVEILNYLLRRSR